MTISVHNTKGITLIEVLIALGIVAIAMAAVIKATSQNIRATHYLQTKTIAMWVGRKVMNEARTGVLRLPTGNKLQQTQEMLGITWYWQAEQKSTANRRIKKIEVAVFTSEKDQEEDSPIINLESYVYMMDES